MLLRLFDRLRIVFVFDKHHIANVHIRCRIEYLLSIGNPGKSSFGIYIMFFYVRGLLLFPLLTLYIKISFLTFRKISISPCADTYFISTPIYAKFSIGISKSTCKRSPFLRGRSIKMHPMTVQQEELNKTCKDVFCSQPCLFQFANNILPSCSYDKHKCYDR